MSIDSLLVTQNHAHGILLQFSENMNKLPHSLLFYGPNGSGKTHYAYFFAHDVLCLDDTEKRACKHCLSCKSWEKHAHPDIHRFSPDQGFSMGIDTAKKIQETVRWKPAYGEKKIILIDDLHALTHEAFNCLLKTLEEPGPSTIFIMTASQMELIPSTILSRTVRIPFHRWSTQQMDQIINPALIGTMEKDFVLSISQGNVKKAIQYCNEEHLKEAMLWIEKWVAFLVQPSASFPTIPTKNVNDFLDLWKWLLREWYSLKLFPSKESILYQNEKLKEWLKIDIKLNRLLDIQEALIHLEMELKKTRMQPKSNLEYWMMKSKQCLSS